MDETGWSSLELSNNTKGIVGEIAGQPSQSVAKPATQDKFDTHLSLAFAVCADGTWSTPMFLFEGEFRRRSQASRA